MHWRNAKRCLSILAAGSALMLAAACGGGDKGPTGPGGDNNIAGNYDLVALGGAGLPADVEPEDCTVTRFYSGGLQLKANGTWQLGLQFSDENYGNSGYEDDGQFEQDGRTVWLKSAVSGSRYHATIEGDQVNVMYDWCYDGVPDVELTFGR
jgi:hypothetical protein